MVQNDCWTNDFGVCELYHQKMEHGVTKMFPAAPGIYGQSVWMEFYIDRWPCCGTLHVMMLIYCRYRCTLLKNMYELQKNGFLCDLLLRAAGGQVIPVHANVMCGSSSFFKEKVDHWDIGHSGKDYLSPFRLDSHIQKKTTKKHMVNKFFHSITSCLFSNGVSLRVVVIWH